MVLQLILRLYFKEYLTPDVFTQGNDTYRAEIHLLRSANASFYGNYTCEATNSEGIDVANFIIGTLSPAFQNGRQSCSFITIWCHFS